MVAAISTGFKYSLLRDVVYSPHVEARIIRIWVQV
jgi:hypothetical protein